MKGLRYERPRVRARYEKLSRDRHRLCEPAAGGYARRRSSTGRRGRDSQGRQRGSGAARNAGLTHAPGRPHQMTPEKPVLLVVDDEPGILKLIDRFAGKIGFEVTAAH